MREEGDPLTSQPDQLHQPWQSMADVTARAPSSPVPGNECHESSPFLPLQKAIFPVKNVFKKPQKCPPLLSGVNFFSEPFKLGDPLSLGSAVFVMLSYLSGMLQSLPCQLLRNGEAAATHMASGWKIFHSCYKRSLNRGRLLTALVPEPEDSNLGPPACGVCKSWKKLP